MKSLFGIITSPRCGTHMLRSALFNSPGVFVHGEVFNTDNACWTHTFGSGVVRELASRISWVDVLYRDEWTNRFNNAEKVGFILHSYQGWHTSIWSELDGIDIVRLRRNNLLRVFVSEVIARENGVWQSYNSGTNNTRIKLDVNKFKVFVDDWNNQWAYILGITSNCRVFDMAYEELINGSIWPCLLEYLGLKYCEFAPGTVKQNPQRLRDILINYDDIVGTLYDLGFGHWLNE